MDSLISSCPIMQYKIIVAQLTHSIVYKQDVYVSEGGQVYGPVALKVTDEGTLSAKVFSTMREGTPHLVLGHSILYEAWVYCALGPHPLFPRFIDCILDTATPLSDRFPNRFVSQQMVKVRQEDEKSLEVGFTKGIGTPCGVPVLILDFVKGVSLDKLFYSFPRLPFQLVLQFLIPVINALEFIHSKGFVHGDLKLSNVLVDARGKVWMVDLASAKQVHRDRSDTRHPLEQSAAAVYSTRMTEHIRAPELWMVPTEDEIVFPHMLDVWSLGVLLVELLTGTPFLVSEEINWLKRTSSNRKEVESFFDEKVAARLRQVSCRYRQSSMMLPQSPSAASETGMIPLGPLRKDAYSFITSLMAIQPGNRLGFMSPSPSAPSHRCDWKAIRQHPFLQRVWSLAPPGRQAMYWSEALEDEVEELLLGL